MVRLSQMEAFVSVVEAGSFVRGAERMGLSPAMISKHIAELEAHLGVRLLNRTTRRIALTEVGRDYFQECTDILQRIAEADARAGDMAIAPKGVLRINAPATFGTMHLAPRLAAFNEAYPEVVIDLSLNDRVVDLVEEGFDVALRIGRLTDSSLIARRLCDMKVVVAGAPSYFKAHGTPKKVEDLRHHKVLSYSHWSDGQTWRFGTGRDEVRVDVSPAMIANNGEAVAKAAVGGMGVIIQPTFIIGDYLKSGELVQVLKKAELPEISLHALYPETRHVPAKVRVFIDFMIAHFGSGTPSWD